MRPCDAPLLLWDLGEVVRALHVGQGLLGVGLVGCFVS